MNRQLLAPQVEEVHLRDYLVILLRRRRTFLISFVAVVAGVMLFTFCQPSLYESTATLLVKDDKGKLGQMSDLLLNSAAPIDAELEILKSRTTAEKVVAALHLNWKVDKRSEGVGFTPVAFSSTAKVPVYTVQLLGGGRYLVRDSEGNSVETGTDGVLLRSKTVSLLLNDIKGETGDSFRITLLPFNQTVANLRKGVKAAEVGKKTNVISVTYTDEDPRLARDVVNALVQAYLEQGIAFKAEEATRTIGFIEEQLEGIKTELDGAEKNLESYKSASGVIQLDTEAKSLIQNLTDAERQKAEASLQRKQVEFALASLKTARERGTVYSPALLREDPLVAGLASRLAELEVQKKGLLSDSTEGHPGVKSVQTQIEEVQRKLQATYETSLKGWEKQEQNISREISRHDTQLKRLPVAERDLARLMRLSKVNADMYTFLLQKHEEARIAKASTISNINVVDPAIAADGPVSPNRTRNLLLGVIGGLMTGLGLCFFRDYLDDSLQDPEQVKRTLDMPLLAVIPFIPVKECEAALVSHEAPKSAVSEAFRALRTRLDFCRTEKEKQVILVTSTFLGEGKTTVASNLGITLAQTGARVLILDCDLRRGSTLHEKYGHPRAKGLTEVLSGEVGAKAAIQVTKVDGLDLLQAGAYPPNPAELLGSKAMVHLVEEMRMIYSHIIIDATPLLAVTDAPVLTRVSDLVILVLEAGRVPARAALRTRELLQTTAISVAGIVVSDKNAKSGCYCYGYGYGYQGDKELKNPWWWLKKGVLLPSRYLRGRD